MVAVRNINKRIKTIFYHFILVIILLLPLVLGNELTKKYSSILYILQLLVFYIYLYENKMLLLYFTPIMLTIFYVDISFGLGSFAYSNEIIVYTKDFQDYLSWKFTNYLTFYVLSANYLLFLLELPFKKRYLKVFETIYTPSYSAVNTHKYLLVISISFFILFLFLKIDLSYLGGSGEITYVPKAISALILINYLAFHKVKFRFVYYFLILFIFAAFSYDSKREAIFLIFPILLLESILNMKTLRLKAIFLLLIVAIVSLLLILIMTTMRAHDIGNTPQIFETLPLVIEYVSSDRFLAYFFLNIETSYTYFHSMQAMEYVMNNLNLLEYGLTFLKFLFITIPSSVIDFKPNSVVHLYTFIRDPAYRLAGGSWAVSIYSEFFWNFYFCGLLFILPYFYLFSSMFLWLIKYIKSGTTIKQSWMLFAYMSYISLLRGSGLDLYVIYTLFALLFSLQYTMILCLVTQKTKKLE